MPGPLRPSASSGRPEPVEGRGTRPTYVSFADPALRISAPYKPFEQFIGGGVWIDLAGGDAVDHSVQFTVWQNALETLQEPMREEFPQTMRLTGAASLSERLCLVLDEPPNRRP